MVVQIVNRRAFLKVAKVCTLFPPSERNAAFLAATNTLNCPAKDAGFLAVNATIEAMIRRYLRS